jgi:hypothetical protein
MNNDNKRHGRVNLINVCTAAPLRLIMIEQFIDQVPHVALDLLGGW